MPNVVEDVEALFYIRFLEYFVTNSYQHIVHKNIFFVVRSKYFILNLANEWQKIKHVPKKVKKKQHTKKHAWYAYF